MVPEGLQLHKKFIPIRLKSVWKEPVKIFCILLDLVRTGLQDLGMEIVEEHFILQVIRNLPNKYDIQC